MNERRNEGGYGRRNNDDFDQRRGGGGRGVGGDRDRVGDSNNNHRANSWKANQNDAANKLDFDRRTNLRALEKSGFVHLYGLAPVLNALSTNRRDLVNPEATIDSTEMSKEEREYDEMQRSRKAEAKFAPCLFVQERGGGEGMGSSSGRLGGKVGMVEELERLAKERDVPVARVDKGVLNTLCGSRPHQGYVLRCGELDFESLPQIPKPSETPTTPSLWLILDEVVDPQNFGAILRSAYFLGGDSGSNKQKQQTIGIVVCAKNSAPPSSTVSAASAGALELSQIYATSNLPRTLNTAKEDGWRILGASAAVPPSLAEGGDGGVTCLDLMDVEVDRETGTPIPTILVLGSEGRGLRTLVAKACTGFVRIPGSSDVASGLEKDEDGGGSPVGVDSLNVSVTGGIMLWHLMGGGGSR